MTRRTTWLLILGLAVAIMGVTLGTWVAGIHARSGPRGPLVVSMEFGDDGRLHVLDRDGGAQDVGVIVRGNPSATAEALKRLGEVLWRMRGADGGRESPQQMVLRVRAGPSNLWAPVTWAVQVALDALPQLEALDLGYRGGEIEVVRISLSAGRDEEHAVEVVNVI